MRNPDVTSRDIIAMDSPCELMERQWAPCRWACPVHADVRTYIQLLAEGRYAESVEVIRHNLAFACVCGRICHHPCENNCRRADVDEPLAIRELKRFVSERIGAQSKVSRPAKPNGLRVAVIGSGPAGMACALDLARLGYSVTVFEKQPVAGGIPRLAIPAYRLPRDVLQADIDWIISHGVELRTGVEIGKHKTIPLLIDEGFRAVVIAVGLSASKMLPLPNIEHPRVYPALDFLRELGLGNKPDVGEDVLVIGGGNVAMDAARSTLRLGVRRVRVMCLEDVSEMPAWEWERHEGGQEGVEFINRRGPVEIIVADGRISAVKTVGVRRVFDDQKRFSPKFNGADIRDIPCDTVIVAIGQSHDAGYLHGSGLEADEGRVKFNPLTQQTSRSDVFACGEIISPPGSVVEACASGARVAKCVHMYVGCGDAPDDALPEKIGTVPATTAAKVVKVARHVRVIAPPSERARDWRAIDENLSEDQAFKEARRCMGCGGGALVLVDKCAACMTCARVCPFDVPKITDVARIDPDLCQSCGICMAECPSGAIISRSDSVSQQRIRTARAIESLDGKSTKVIAFIGGYHASAEEWTLQEEAIDGVAEVYLTSSARLGTMDILNALEKCDGVIVVACPERADRYPQACGRTSLRVEQARKLLEQAGLDPRRVGLSFSAAGSRDEIVREIRQFLAELGEQS